MILVLASCKAEVPDASAQTPRPTAASEKVIGTFQTKILDTDPERVNNLALCANSLNGTLVASGEEFSFNKTVGERTSDKGYKPARILTGDEADCAVGGGVCQISSTLFNAAADAGMEIVERHNHQNEVHYVEIGRDAAVSYGTLDFRFKNPLQNSVRINIAAENGAVTAKIVLLP